MFFKAERSSKILAAWNVAKHKQSLKILPQKILEGAVELLFYPMTPPVKISLPGWPNIEWQFDYHLQNFLWQNVQTEFVFCLSQVRYISSVGGTSPFRQSQHRNQFRRRADNEKVTLCSCCLHLHLFQILWLQLSLTTGFSWKIWFSSIWKSHMEIGQIARNT